MSLSRRSFLKGVGALAAAAGLAPVARLVPPVVPAIPAGFHPDKVKAIYLAQRWELAALELGPGIGDVDVRLLRQFPVEPARGIVHRWADDSFSGPPWRETPSGGI